MYESEFTQFMRSYLAHHPDIEQQREQLRLTWWDREVNFDELSRLKAISVPRAGYAYQ